MKLASLFAGIGGFDLAAERLGIEVVYANEWDKYAADIYDQHFTQKVQRQDITTVDATAIPDHDILVGGFPCQAFSVAGKRRGFDEARGTLFFDVARILQCKRPSYFVLENVKGLLSHDKGNTIRVIIATLDELGYDLQWQVLNSKDFGVPQNRERIFIVGHLRGIPRPEVFPFTQSDRGDTQSQGEAPSQGQRLRSDYSPIANTLAQRDYKGGNNLIQLNPGTPQSSRVYDQHGISPSLDIAAGGNRQPKIIDIKAVGSTTRRGLIKDGYTGALDHNCLQGVANTIDSHYYKGPSPSGHQSKQRIYEIEGRIRRLTPTECERLQGFPDGWTQGVSDTQRYKCLGNAVTVNVVQAVLARLLQ